jgi:hypothetical protein
MKHLLCTATCFLVAGMSFAQTDATTASDTITVGNFRIVKNNNSNISSSENRDMEERNWSRYAYRIERVPEIIRIHTGSRIVDIRANDDNDGLKNKIRNFFRKTGRLFRSRGRKYYDTAEDIQVSRITKKITAI